METEHNMQVGVRDKQAVACLTINSRYTAGGQARIVYNALVDKIFIADAMCYAFELPFLTRHISETA